MTQTQTTVEFVNLPAAIRIYETHTFAVPDGSTGDYLLGLTVRGLLTGRAVSGEVEIGYDSLIALTELDMDCNLRRVREELDGDAS